MHSHHLAQRSGGAFKPRDSNMGLGRVVRVLAAFTIAPMAPVLSVAVLNGALSSGFVFTSVVVSYLHSAMGVPIFLWLRRGGRLRWGTVIIAAALIGCVPITLLTFSLPLPDFESVGNQVTVQHGRLTLLGYWGFIRDTFMSAALGISAGVVWVSIITFRGTAAATHVCPPRDAE
jgi:hypothetical protein